jgi:hypothetical protein
MDYLPYSHVRKHEEKWRRRGLKDVLNESAMESIAERLWLEDAAYHRSPHPTSSPAQIPQTFFNDLPHQQTRCSKLFHAAGF